MLDDEEIAGLLKKYFGIVISISENGQERGIVTVGVQVQDRDGNVLMWKNNLGHIRRLDWHLRFPQSDDFRREILKEILHDIIFPCGGLFDDNGKIHIPSFSSEAELKMKLMLAGAVALR